MLPYYIQGNGAELQVSCSTRHSHKSGGANVSGTTVNKGVIQPQASVGAGAAGDCYDKRIKPGTYEMTLDNPIGVNDLPTSLIVSTH